MLIAPCSNSENQYWYFKETLFLTNVTTIIMYCKNNNNLHVIYFSGVKIYMLWIIGFLKKGGGGLLVSSHATSSYGSKWRYKCKSYIISYLIFNLLYLYYSFFFVSILNTIWNICSIYYGRLVGGGTITIVASQLPWKP